MAPLRSKAYCSLGPPGRSDRPPEGERPFGLRWLPYNSDAVTYWEAEISLVIGINQTNHSTNQERPCTTLQRIKKELSICPSSLRPNLVNSPCWVKLSRILHAWWCHSANSFKFQPCDGTPP